ncbi:S41 family peptidase [Chloroflexus aggregans]|uniref:Carboxyl-terminal protease n=1 Tax=Chloroflexus aggregans (strain MD-66 / DSM 9485) TaxID=326427 RepID=B8GAN3_CHLAD|nr:S41 family peptidase [Chloroflexus aggregans]ACL24622.1 carboxyl-terminal protease [Chloroflexus aggregans DSM 9485]
MERVWAIVGVIVRWVAVIAVAFLGGWITGRIVGVSPIDVLITGVSNVDTRLLTPGDRRQQFAVFWDVWDLVEGNFYQPQAIDRQKMVYGAIRGMLATLNDPYTFFQEPEEAQQNRESMEGRFEGIGAYLRVENGQIIIDRPIRNSPAEQAGIQAGDIILAVDDQPLAELIAGLSDQEASARAVSLIRGPAGTVVRLTIHRPAEDRVFTVAITRAAIPLITVNSTLLPDRIAYIQITEFKATTTELLDQAIAELLPQQPRAIVLDLRNNSGGFLTTAQEVLGRFYDGVALYEEERSGVNKELRTITAPANRRLYGIPMVVLVNGGSASAAEVVAGALRDVRPNTVLLGEKTFGKGSVQNIYPLRDGSSVRITIARWLTPSGEAINGVGITPEHVVPAANDPIYQVPCVPDRPNDTGCADAQLYWALKLLRDGTPPPLPVPVETVTAP